MSSSEQKPATDDGRIVLLPCKVVFTLPPSMVPNSVELAPCLADMVIDNDGEPTIWASPLHLLPAPREGEYTITAAELHDICELYTTTCVAIPWFGDERTQLEWVKKRLHDLKQRKEARHA